MVNQIFLQKFIKRQKSNWQRITPGSTQTKLKCVYIFNVYINTNNISTCTSRKLSYNYWKLFLWGKKILHFWKSNLLTCRFFSGLPVNEPFEALLRRLKHKVRGQVNQEQWNILIELLIYCFSLNAAFQAFGHGTKQAGLEHFEGRIDSHQLL